MENFELFFLNDLEERAHKIYSRLTKEPFSTKTNNKKLEFKIIKSYKINAKALSDNDIDYIEYNDGTLKCINNYVYNFTENYTLDIINSFGFSQFTRGEKDGNLFEVFNSNKLETYEHMDIKKQIYQLIMTDISRFILTHEIGHLLNGHVEYLQEKSENKLNCFEMNFSYKDSEAIKKNILLIKTLEYDADSFAAFNSIEHILSLYNNFEKDVENLHLPPKKLFFWWAFSMRFLFMLFEEEGLNNDKDSVYLPNLIRFNMILNIAFIYLEQKEIDGFIRYTNKDNLDTITTEIINGITTSEEYFNKKNGTNMDYINDMKIMMSNNCIKNQVQEVEENWKVINTELSHYSRLSMQRKFL